MVRIRVQGTADQAAFEAAVKAPTAKVCDLHPRAVLRPGPWKANNVGCAFYRQIQFLEDMPEDMQIGMLVGLPSGLNNLGAFDCAGSLAGHTANANHSPIRCRSSLRPPALTGALWNAMWLA